MAARVALGRHVDDVRRQVSTRKARRATARLYSVPLFLLLGWPAPASRQVLVASSIAICLNFRFAITVLMQANILGRFHPSTPIASRIAKFAARAPNRWFANINIGKRGAAGPHLNRRNAPGFPNLTDHLGSSIASIGPSSIRPTFPFQVGNVARSKSRPPTTFPRHSGDPTTSKFELLSISAGLSSLGVQDTQASQPTIATPPSCP